MTILKLNWDKTQMMTKFEEEKNLNCNKTQNYFCDQTLIATKLTLNSNKTQKLKL